MQCKQCAQQFEITAGDRVFYSKLAVPEPTLCPDCRAQRRMGWRNERTLYSAICALCKKSIITNIAPDGGFVVYCRDCWWSDKWDSSSYGRDFNFNRPFFEQFNELLRATPHYNLFHSLTNENADYQNYAGANKNVYMVFNSGYNEDLYYSRGTSYSKDCIDMLFNLKNEHCSNDINCRECYNLHFSLHCLQCLDSSFLYDCLGCSNCTGCVNLRHKQYCFFNEQLSKEEYGKRLKETRLHTYSGLERMKRRFAEFLLTQPRRAAQIVNCEGSTGNYLRRCKDAVHCFEMEEAENVKYCDSSKFGKDEMDLFGWGYYSELLYETVGTGSSNRSAFCVNCGNVNNLYYGCALESCENCFGCANMKRAKFCILNKAYPEDEYRVMREKIVMHMRKTGEYGEFFPLGMSTFNYNETLAQENYPLEQTEVRKRGWRWQETLPGTFGKTTLASQKIPDAIDEVSDSIVSEILECLICRRNYQIIKPELAFYRKVGLPLPRKCFNCRHHERIVLRGPRKLWKRGCMRENCPNTFETAFSPEGKEIVYCEPCYKKAVY